MKTWRFDGLTAVVTGAGGNPSLGRAHAMLLASLGANVVVNDIGVDEETPGYEGAASAVSVAREICDLGGRAVADSNSVASEAGGQAIVQTAIDAFGSIDILVNNAGLSIAAPFDRLTSRDFQRHINVNLMGPVWTCRAAWPHMRSRGYGRIVNTVSRALTGVRWLSAYAASKGGVFSLTRALAAEGAEFGIKVNAVSPGAFTRMVVAQQEAQSPMIAHARANLPPELVSPVVAFLAHSECSVTGECIETLGGQVRRMQLVETAGISDPELSVASAASRWEEIMSGAIAQVVASGDFDPVEWHIKPY